MSLIQSAEEKLVERSDQEMPYAKNMLNFSGYDCDVDASKDDHEDHEKLSNTSSSDAGNFPLETQQQLASVGRLEEEEEELDDPDPDPAAVSDFKKLRPVVKKLQYEFGKTDVYKEIFKRYPEFFQHGRPDEPAFFCSTQHIARLKRKSKNPVYVRIARAANKVLTQDQCLNNLVLGLTGPEEEREERMKRAREEPSLKPILDDIENGTVDETMKNWTNAEELVRKICEALRSSTCSSDQGADDVIEDSTAAESEEEYVEADYKSPVLNAAKDGNVEALKDELEKNPGGVDDVDERGLTALHLACGYGELKCAEVLIEKCANVDARDKHEHTPLHYAAWCGEVGCVDLLLKHGASVTAENLLGESAREVAEINGQMEVVALLDKYLSLPACVQLCDTNWCSKALEKY